MLDKYIYYLSRTIGGRGSATGQERRAAEYCRTILADLGYAVTIQPFRALTTFSWLYMVFYLLPLVAWGLNMPWISFIGAMLFFLDLNTYPVLSRLFPTGPSQNVYASISAGVGQKVLIVAHLDSSKAGLNFSPALVKGFRTSFLIMVASIISAPILLVAAAFFGDIVRWVALVPCLYLVITAAMLLHREIWNKYTDGANDNASGVAAALELAERCKIEMPPGVDVRILLTGCEESGTYGMIEFIKQKGEEHRNALFINLDNIGAGNLYYMSGEGMFPVYNAPSEILDICKMVAECRPELNVKQGVYSLLSTDAMPLLARGFKAVSFLALDDKGMLPNWHWPSDVLENVQLSTVNTAVEFVYELLKEIGRKELYESRNMRDIRRIK